ncbi:unnamed protein product [Ophioblennius macclurei]
MLLILAITCWLFKASSSQISSNGDTTAEYGGDAHYSCALADPTGVRQVTWQRLFKDQSVENLATYSPRFGRQVNAPYLGKVVFTEAMLNSTAITLRNVTWHDESCYICSFNVFPDGSKGRQTCLTVQGISKTSTSVQTHNEAEGHHSEVVLSCSATGKPAPTIHWELPPGASSSTPEQTQTVSNSDHTFTSSSKVMLKFDASWEGHLDCVLNRGKPGQRTETIPLVVQHDKPEEAGIGASNVGVVLTVFVLLVAICTLAVLVTLKHKRWKYQRRDGAVV